MHSSQFAVAAPDRALIESLQHKVDRKTKPLGALGQLEAIALKIGLVQQTLTPRLDNPQMLVFAGDHGAARAGVSAFPQDVTWQMVENFLAGGAGINVFARQNGLGLTVVDAGVAHDFGQRPGLVNAKVAPGTRNYIEEPAMSAAQCAAAMEHGAGIVRGLAAARKMFRNRRSRSGRSHDRWQRAEHSDDRSPPPSLSHSVRCADCHG